jgi:hypothetical protein
MKVSVRLQADVQRLFLRTKQILSAIAQCPL